MNRRLAAFLAAFAVIALLLGSAPSVSAQINGAPTSVTSPGFGGRAVNGTPSSVTSVGPRGYAPGPRATFSTTVPPVPPDTRRSGAHPRHRHSGYGVPLLYAVPVPYGVESAPPDEEAEDGDANYQGGPTVFDRRGEGERSYIPPVRDVPNPHNTSTQNPQELAQNDAPAPSADDNPDPTMLIFKDGHQLEVGNYAIVGTTLYDLTPGHARKVPLSDLDLEATRKQNENHGVIFQLPPSLRTN